MCGSFVCPPWREGCFQGMLKAPEKMISAQQNRGKVEIVKGSTSQKVIVAVKSSKEVPKNALVWALTHVVQPGDCITLLVLVPSQSSGISHST